MTMNDRTLSEREARLMKAVVQRIAAEELMIETLEPRGRDGLDFHDCGVVSIRFALEAAYRAGMTAAAIGKK